MSTAAKAAVLIGQALSQYPSWKHLEIAIALDNAGLLAPEQPNHGAANRTRRPRPRAARSRQPRRGAGQ